VGLKERLRAWLAERGHAVDDRAAHVGEEVVDYPPLCEDVCARVLDGDADFAIVVGGSGSGEALACNKIRGIRAALCLDLFAAEIARANNNANVLVTGAKVVSSELAERILATWLATSFRGERHQRRLDQIATLERLQPVALLPPLGGVGLPPRDLGELELGQPGLQLGSPM
jgi:ribose 5-phosphate isomerase B